MFRFYAAQVLCFLGVLLAVLPVRAMDAKKEVLLCSIAEADSTKQNPMLVMRFKENELDRKNRSWMTCTLPEVTEKTLLPEIMGQSVRKHVDSVILYLTDLEVAGNSFSTGVTHGKQGRFGSGDVLHGRDLLGRVCGFSSADDRGLSQKQIGKNPVCEAAGPEFFGETEDGSIVFITCGYSNNECVVTVNYHGWYFLALDVPERLIDYWRDVEKAILADIESRTVFRRAGGYCVGNACAFIESVLE